MKFSAFMIAAGIPLVGPASAGVKSGHASVELLSGGSETGKPVTVGIHLTIEPGWHSYWVNPGEGGMPLKAKWTLPAGWTAGELRQPVPKRFKTGDLPGFGYEGAATFLVDLTPPADAKGEALVKVKVSWLTCNESACVPGDAELSFTPGKAADGGALAEAAKKIPQPLAGAKLEVAEKDQQVTLTLALPAGADATGCAAFPATPQTLDAGAPIEFTGKSGKWTATVPKSEYAEGPARELELVLAGGKLAAPVSVKWQAGK